MPVLQYPHNAIVTVTTDGGTDANGYPLPPTTTDVSLICRAEPNIKNAVVYLPDGTAFEFKYIVYIKWGNLL